MRMFLRRLLPLATLLVLTTRPAAAAAPSSSCQFVLGFAALHDADPPAVGACTDNQTFAANGDSIQHTTRGMLAWRKADNWTAFTDGYQTWVNGPDGLQQRLNSERFPWEGPEPSPTPTPLPSPTATPVPAPSTTPRLRPA